MALLVIQTTDGRSVLIHSSQIGPMRPRPETAAERERRWRAAWARFEQALDSADARGAWLGGMAKHPRDMTDAELRSLPTVNRFAGEAVRSFEGAGGSRWSVGRSGTIWVKTHIGEPKGR